MDIVYSENTAQSAADHITRVIKMNLSEGRKVLWLLSGGSGIHTCLAVALQLQGLDLSNLSVTLTDERYGSVGHDDENWQQLLDGGFNVQTAKTYRPLSGDDITITSDKYGAWMMQEMSTADYIIGLFGIGNDGHTAGIKPDSPVFDATAWVEHYKGDDFDRITMTPFAIEQVHEIVVQVSGIEKLDTVRTLLHKNIDALKQPAQLLKLAPTVTIYTNYEEI